MSQHDTLTLEPCPFCGNEAHFVDDLIIVYASCPNCGATGAHSSYRSGAANAWNRRAALSAAQPAQAKQSDWGAQQFKAPVYPPDGTESPFTVINLGSGKVQMGDSVHDGRLPALWFGINGQGMGHEEVMNREARPGETLAVVTFANVEGLDVLLDVIQRIRREKFPEAKAAQGAGEVVAWQASDGGSSYISNEARSRNSAFRELYTIPLYTQPAAGADVPDMVEIMALADSYRNATCQEATASAREWLRAAIAASGRKS